MMGRGLVDPVDFHHSDNPPSHPALLKTLATEFVNTGFDYRELLRQIALSQTFQLSVDLSDELSLPDTELAQRIESLDASITAEGSELDTQTSDDLTQRLDSRREKLAAVDAEITNSAKRLKELETESSTLAKAQKELDKNAQSKANSARHAKHRHNSR